MAFPVSTQMYAQMHTARTGAQTAATREQPPVHINHHFEDPNVLSTASPHVGGGGYPPPQTSHPMYAQPPAQQQPYAPQPQGQQMYGGQPAAYPPYQPAQPYEAQPGGYAPQQQPYAPQQQPYAPQPQGQNQFYGSQQAAYTNQHESPLQPQGVSPPSGYALMPLSQGVMESNADSIRVCAVSLTVSSNRARLLEHHSVPRLLPQDIEADLEKLPPAATYITPARPISLRPTFGVFPGTPEIADSLHLPTGINLRPFAEVKLPEVDPATFGNRMIRCRKCTGYINPFTSFADGGRRWQCILCRQMNETSNDYMCPLDPQYSLRQDLMNRPELLHCSVDYYPTQEFLRRPPKRPIMLLMLDCSYPAVASGLLGKMCEGALEALESMKDDDVMHMGVVGFDATVYFFNLSSSLGAPRVIAAPDTVNDLCNVNDSFKLDPLELPCSISELIVPIKESYRLLRDLLSKLPGLFATTKEVGCAFGPALAASISMLENNGGKIIASVCSIPSLGEGKLKHRFDIAKLTNLPKEYTMCASANDWYKQRALVCSNSSISVDLIAGGTTDLDLTTIAPLARLTSGSIHRATPQTMDSMRAQIRHMLLRFTAFDSVLRVRTSNGLIVPNFYGHCHVREPDLLALPIADEDSSYSVELKVTPNFKGTFGYVQFAVVYTTRARERRIRVHTMQIPISTSVGRVINSANSIGMACFLSKMCVDLAVNGPFPQAQQKITDKVVNFLKTVSKQIGSQNANLPAGHLLLPESLRFLPQILSGFFRYPATGAATVRPIPPDERVVAMAQTMSSPPEAMLGFFLGWCYQVYSPRVPVAQLPTPMYSAQSYFSSEGIFLVNTGVALVLWYGKTISPAVLRRLGLQSAPDVLGGAPEEALEISAEEFEGLRGRTVALIEQHKRLTGPAFQAELVECPAGGSVFEPTMTRCMTEDVVKVLPSYSEFLKALWTKVTSQK